MTLSEAMRLGAAKRPQVVGAPFAWTVDANGYARLGSCAQGAAYEGLTDDIVLPGAGDPAMTLFDAFPVTERMTACPVADCRWLGGPMWGDQAGVLTVVWHLNDNHEWTREAIADWVETQEAA